MEREVFAANDGIGVSEVRRYGCLDSLRGLAAFMVLIGHTFFVENTAAHPLHTILDWSPLRILWSGHEAVILFFVLSGFSLFMMFESMSGSRNALATFVAARWCRLYPVYFVSILLALVAYNLLGGLGFSAPPDKVFIPTGQWDPAELLWHLTLVGKFDYQLYNGPIWSIVHEMRISIIFPLIYLLVLRWGGAAVMLAAAGSVLLGVMLIDFRYPPHLPVGIDYLSTLHYCTFFFVGAFIAKHRMFLTEKAGQWHARSRWLLLIAAILIFLYAMPVAIYLAEGMSLGAFMLADLAINVGACGIVLVALVTPFMARNNLLLGLGKISFSLYLVHYTCIAAVNMLLGHQLPFPVLFATEVVIAVLASILVWRLVEVPSLTWSRRLRKAVPGLRFARAAS